MTHFKAALILAVGLALPSVAIAQISTGAKEKAVETVIENATADDALTAGKVLLKGGSKEEAAIAIVKKRANDKIEGVVGETASDAISENGLSTDTAIAVGKEKLGGVASSYGSGAAGAVSSFGSGTSGAETESKTLTESAKDLLPSLSGESADKAPADVAPVEAKPAVNCPAGTTLTDFGDCAITGDWKF